MCEDASLEVSSSKPRTHIFFVERFDFCMDERRVASSLLRAAVNVRVKSARAEGK
jgi:hypothetical protein